VKKTRRYALPEFFQFAAFVMSFVLAAGAMTALTGCAVEDDDAYPLAIPDTTDGDDDVIVSQEDLPGASDGVVRKTLRDLAIQHCQEIQWMHYERSACYQTYHNDNWLGGALQHCVNYVNNVVTEPCLDEYNSSVYWQTRREFINVPYPGYYFGDKFRWYCLGGWPVKSTPNDTDALHNAWVACEPGV